MAGKISLLDAVKAQARAVVPIVRALERELGKERAHALVREAIAQEYAERVARRTAERDTHPRVNDPAAAFPVTARIALDDADRYGVDMVRCEFADHFRAIGEPEIGALLTCGVDFAVEAKLRPSWEFTRTQTVMQGAPHCDFRWKRRGR